MHVRGGQRETVIHVIIGSRPDCRRSWEYNISMAVREIGFLQTRWSTFGLTEQDFFLTGWMTVMESRDDTNSLPCLIKVIIIVLFAVIAFNWLYRYINLTYYYYIHYNIRFRCPRCLNRALGNKSIARFISYWLDECFIRIFIVVLWRWWWPCDDLNFHPRRPISFLNKDLENVVLQQNRPRP